MKEIEKKLINTIRRIVAEIKWRAKGRPVPPPHFIKQRIIKDYARNFGMRIFVETGTYLGDTTMSVNSVFDELYSIELDEFLFKNAQDKFAAYPHIHIFRGDSSKVLQSVLATIEKPALFWLDGHYSEGITAKGDLNTPVMKELELVLNHKIKNHIILIDDARCFVGKNDYPTIAELGSFIKKIDPELNFFVSDDIIRIIKR